MESQTWHQLASSMGGIFRKEKMASACLDARHISFSLYTTGAFQASTPVLELRGSESEWVSPCVGSLRGTAWGSSSFFHQLNPLWFCIQKLWGLIFLALEPWTGGLVWGPDSSLPRYPSPTFIHVGVGPAHSASVPLLPVSMNVVSLIPLLSDFHSAWFLMFLSDGCSIF